MLMVLRAAFDQDEVNYGTARFRVGVDGLLVVPAVVALHLVKEAGFVVVRSNASHPKPAPRDPESQLLVGVHHPTAAMCSYGGQEYRADGDGNILVPSESVADLKAHGFVPIQLDEPSPYPPPPAGGRAKIHRPVSLR